MRDVIVYLARALVDDPDRVTVEDEGPLSGGAISLNLAVTLEIGRELDLTSLLSLIIARAITLVEAARAGAIYLWDEQAQLLIPQAWHSRGNWMQDVRFALGEGIVGTVAQQRTGLIVNDYQHSSYKHSPFAELFGATAMIAEPLIYRDRLIGDDDYRARHQRMNGEGHAARPVRRRGAGSDRHPECQALCGDTGPYDPSGTAQY